MGVFIAITTKYNLFCAKIMPHRGYFFLRNPAIGGIFFSCGAKPGVEKQPIGGIFFLPYAGGPKADMHNACFACRIMHARHAS